MGHRRHCAFLRDSRTVANPTRRTQATEAESESNPFQSVQNNLLKLMIWNGGNGEIIWRTYCPPCVVLADNCQCEFSHAPLHGHERLFSNYKLLRVLPALAPTGPTKRPFHSSCLVQTPLPPSTSCSYLFFHIHRLKMPRPTPRPVPLSPRWPLRH